MMTIDPSRIRPLTALQLKQLIADLNPNRIAHRAGQGRSAQLSYLEAWDVRAALTRIFGFGGYSYESETKVLKVEDNVPKRGDSGGTQFRVTAMSTLKLYIPQLGAIYEESAVSSQSQPDPGECTDFAVKTAESDALKRCAVNLGTQMGLSLYNKGNTMDVIKRVLDPHQAAILVRLAQGETAAHIDDDLNKNRALAAQAVDVDEPDDSDREYGYDPDHGDTGLAGGGEQPMALEATPQRKAAANDALRAGFDRSPSA